MKPEHWCGRFLSSPLARKMHANRAHHRTTYEQTCIGDNLLDCSRLSPAIADRASIPSDLSPEAHLGQLCNLSTADLVPER